MKNNYKILYNDMRSPYQISVLLPDRFVHREARSLSFIIYLIFTLIKEIDTAYFLPDRFVYAFNS